MTTTVSPTGSAPSTASVVGVAGAAALVALSFTAYGAHTWAEISIVAAAIVLCTALVYGVVLPAATRKQRQDRTALWLSIPALVLLVPAFWSGLPIVLGAAGALLGHAGRRTPTRTGLSTAGMILGVLAVIGYLTIYVSDAAKGGGFFFA